VAANILISLSDFIDKADATIAAVATLAIALFTLTLWRSTEKMWGTTQKALQHAELTAERQLRAYVHVAAASASPVGTLINFYLEVKNFGQTPAYEVKLSFVIKLADLPEKASDLVPPDTPNISQAILPPQVSIHDNFTPPQQLTPNQILKIGSEKAAIFVAGQITYRDIFGRDRLTEFRYYLGKQTGEQTSGALAISAEGNRAT
jgi:hypothetical protein